MKDGRKTIDLISRYGKKHKLVPCACREHRYKYESEDDGPVSFALSPGSNEIDFFDPPGGPAIELGQIIEDKVVAYIESNGGLFLYLSDTVEEAAMLNEKIVSSVAKSAGGECVNMEIDFADVSTKPDKIVIGMIGKAGSGKDTVADYVTSKYGFNKLAFADPLKKAVQIIFDIDDEHMFDRALREETLENWAPWSTRKLLQFVGTDLMRDQIDKNIWVKNAVSRVKRLSRAIISDVRFPNEVDDVKAMLEGHAQMVFIRVTRPDHEDAQGGIKDHASESHIDDLDADIDILNDGTLEDLYMKVDGLMEAILEKGE
jgi:hypothetical protein